MKKESVLNSDKCGKCSPIFTIRYPENQYKWCNKLTINCSLHVKSLKTVCCEM